MRPSRSSLSHRALIVLATGAVALAARNAPAATAWTVVGPLAQGRETQAAVPFGGRWFVGGGDLGSTPGLAIAVEIFDPATGLWTPAAAPLTAGTFPQAAALPATGVAFIGGLRAGGPSDEVDVGDASGAWSVSHLATGRFAHAAAVAGERVVVAGGWSSQSMLDDAEAIPLAALAPSSAATPQWSPLGHMPGGPRIYATMTALADGDHVLVVGGCMSDHAVMSADLLDAAAGTWRAAAAPAEARCNHAASLLADGRVLVTGSLEVNRAPGTKARPSAELYDPASDTWTPAAPMRQGRYAHAQVTLPDGRVLVAGGSDADAQIGDGALASTELYDPRTDRWRDGPDLIDARAFPSAVVLSGGVYVTAGASGSGVVATTEQLSLADLAAPEGDAEESPGPVEGADAAGDATAPSPPPASGCACAAASAPAERSWFDLSAASLVACVLVARRTSRFAARRHLASCSAPPSRRS